MSDIDLLEDDARFPGCQFGMKTAVDRRNFLRRTLDTVSLAVLAGALPPLSAMEVDGGRAPVLFDPRFPAASLAAQRLVEGATLLAVGGDPTDLLDASGTSRAIASDRVLRGVTTESVPFVLEQALARHGRPRLTSRRLDRDLFAWQLEFPA